MTGDNDASAGQGERQAASFREPEQRAQRHDGVVTPVTAQRLQDGVDVTGGIFRRWPRVAAQHSMEGRTMPK